MWWVSGLIKPIVLRTFLFWTWGVESIHDLNYCLGIQTKVLQLLPLAQQWASLYILLLDMAGSVDINLSLMKIFLSNVDFATLHVKIQIICGPPVGTLMKSGMIFANYAKMIRISFDKPFVWSVTQLVRSFREIKWTSAVVDWPRDTTTTIVTNVNLLHIHMKLLY